MAQPRGPFAWGSSPALLGWSVAIAVAAAGLLWLLWDGGLGGLRHFGGLSRDAAIREAASAGGVEWPGSVLSVRDQGEDRAVVERRWLSMSESKMSIVKRRDGWYDGGSPDLGPGEAAQAALVCLVVPATCGLLTRSLVKRGRSSWRPSD